MRTPAPLFLALSLVAFEPASSVAQNAAAAAAPTAPGPVETALLKNTRQLIFEGLRSGEGYFRPDGKALIFQSEREAGNPFYQIYSLDLETGDTRRVSPGQGKTTCAFFQPGGSRVLFSSTHEDPEALAKQKAELDFRASGKTRRYSWDYDPQYEIYSAEADGSDLKRLTRSEGYDAEASFSPDGKQIVFSSTRGAYPLEKLSAEDQLLFQKDPAYFADLYVMNADGSNVRRITHAPGYDGGPFFAPQGDRIFWRRFDTAGMNADIYSARVDGSDVRRVTDFGCMSWAPYPHPGGKYLIFTANKLGFDNFELFLVDAEGTRAPVRVTHTPGFDGLPVFSPDGRTLTWTSNRASEGKSQLFTARWEDAEARRLLEASPVRGGSVGATGGTGVPGAVFSPEIRAADLRAQVEWLASPQRQGRRTGTAGARDSAEWLAARLKESGASALQTGFFYDFKFTAGIDLQPGKNTLEVRREKAPAETYAVEKDFRPLSFSDSGSVEGEVVFAGYGLSVPETTVAGRYNSYDGLDVKDKIVLLLRYVPEGVDAARRTQLNRYGGLRYKAMMARERGAKAVLAVAGPNSPQAGELVGLSNDTTGSQSGIIAHSVSARVAEALLASAGKTLKEAQTALDQENPHVPGGFALPGVKVRVEAGVERRKGDDRNVVAVIPPAAGAPEEWVLVGAHYDHLGKGVESNSMARAGEESGIHHGADDNASGTALVLELAAALAQERQAHPETFKRGVLLGLWSGEEIGLIGSASFVENPPVDLSRIVAYLNFDMVGRLRDNKLTLQGVGSSKAWKRLIEKSNVAAGFTLTLQDDPYLPTDTTSFYPKKIPVLSFFTGAHEDYHRPTDTPEKVDFDGLERITRMASAMVRDLVRSPEKPDYSRVERSKQQESGSRETLRAYIGSIPDYATDVKGVKLSGVRENTPAQKAGLRGGDVIIEFGAQKVANIYDYTYALDAVKIGQPVPVKVLRDGKEVTLTVVPEARK